MSSEFEMMDEDEREAESMIQIMQEIKSMKERNVSLSDEERRK